MHESVKKAHNKIFKSQEKLFAKKEQERIELQEGEKRHGKVEVPGTENPNNVDFEMLRSKADVKDLIKMGELKSNKFDTDLLLKCAEVQHDQMKHIAVIVNEAVKTLINT